MNYADFPPLAGGVYQLADGRCFRAFHDFELVAFARDGWRLQQMMDVRLAVQLDAMRSASVVPPVTAKPVFRVPEQLAWAI